MMSGGKKINLATPFVCVWSYEITAGTERVMNPIQVNIMEECWNKKTEIKGGDKKKTKKRNWKIEIWFSVGLEVHVWQAAGYFYHNTVYRYEVTLDNFFEWMNDTTHHSQYALRKKKSKSTKSRTHDHTQSLPEVLTAKSLRGSQIPVWKHWCIAVWLNAQTLTDYNLTVHTIALYTRQELGMLQPHTHTQKKLLPSTGAYKKLC